MGRVIVLLYDLGGLAMFIRVEHGDWVRFRFIFF